MTPRKLTKPELFLWLFTLGIYLSVALGVLYYFDPFMAARVLRFLLYACLVGIAVVGLRAFLRWLFKTPR